MAATWRGREDEYINGMGNHRTIIVVCRLFLSSVSHFSAKSSRMSRQSAPY
jgi:hypothetical protein